VGKYEIEGIAHPDPDSYLGREAELQSANEE